MQVIHVFQKMEKCALDFCAVRWVAPGWSGRARKITEQELTAMIASVCSMIVYDRDIVSRARRQLEIQQPRSLH